MNEKMFLSSLLKNKNMLMKQYPVKLDVQTFVESLYKFLFSNTKCSSCSVETMFIEWEQIKLEFKRLVSPFIVDTDDYDNELCELFFNEIPVIYDNLILDAKTINLFDPASSSINEVILAYPGFYAITVYRIANLLYNLKIPILPRLFSEYSHSVTGIDINPGATIGKNFFIDHGTGIVIGETSVIGDNVKIYQGVTIGALNVRKEEAKIKRHPTIEDNVIIYSGASILGGKTIIGHDSIIGGNAWITHSISPYSTVYNQSKVSIRSGVENIVRV